MNVSYFHTHPTPYKLIIIIIIIIITLMNHQSNIIQHNFHTLSMKITSSYFVLNYKAHYSKNFFTCLLCDWPSIRKILFRPSISYKTHPLSLAGYK